jgi:hypothetical protein
MGSMRNEAERTFPILRATGEVLLEPQSDRKIKRMSSDRSGTCRRKTVDAVCAAIGEVLQAFTPEECASYLKNSGYRT